MRSLISVIVLSCSLLASLSEAKLKENAISAGAAVTNLDVPHGIALAGYGQRLKLWGSRNDLAYYFKPSIGQNDPIRVKTLVLKNNNARQIFISVDLVGIFPRMKADLVKRLKDFGIREDEILIAATHTHSGPGGFVELRFWEMLAADKFKPQFFLTVVDAMEHSVRAAVARLEPAKISFSHRHIEGLTDNRRGSKQNEPVLTLMRVDSLTQHPIGTLLNFPIHGTLLGPENEFVSADVPGALEREFEAQTGSVALFLSGAAGDINPSGVPRTFAGASELARNFVHAALPAYKEVNWKTDVLLRATSVEVTLDKPRINKRKCLTGNRSRNVQAVGFATAPRLLPDDFSVPLKIRGVQIGDHLFIAVPGEPITQLGIEAQRLAREAGMASSSIIGLADSYMGYILTETEYRRGGYESCNSFYGESYGQRFLDATAALVKK